MHDPKPKNDSSPANGHTRVTIRERVYSALASGIRSGMIAPGRVLLEGPIAEGFRCSRAPVRSALTSLHEDGLVQRFQGRGYLAGTRPGMEIDRTPLDPSLFDGEAEDAPHDLVSAPDAGLHILTDIRRTAGTAMAFGEFRINQSKLARHYGISRARAAELLLLLNEQRVIWRDARGTWLVGPLTARAVREQYELRALLEPAALVQSAPKLLPNALRPMLDRVDRLAKADAGATPDELEAAEQDLHEQCLANADNRHMLTVIDHSKLPLLVNTVFVEAVGRIPDLPELAEHREILLKLMAGETAMAAELLSRHLRLAASRTLQRLKAISVLPDPDLPDYLTRR
ncbi:MAG: GntR family transcriptional regulator [Roseovarius sp.]|uniref:GntR family transcriptional regulator n=1 Tax=Roseovarius sp. TaxID=1486281 RepID=UPI0032EDE875